MKLLWQLVTLTGVLFISKGQAERILVLSPIGTRSHVYGVLPAVEALAERGHQITLVTAHPHKTQSSNIHNVVIEGVAAVLEGDLQSFESETYWGVLVDMIKEFRMCASLGYSKFVANSEIKEIMRTRSVDLIILDGILNEFSMPFIDRIKVPFIIYSPANAPPWILQAMGAYQEYSVVPSIAADFKGRMSFYQRLINLMMNEVFFAARQKFLLDMVDEMVKKDFPNSRPVAEIERDAKLCLLNVDRATARARSLPPTMIPIGAMHCRSPKPLTGELQQFADEADQGFIVFTLGSNARLSAMSDRLRDILVRVFARIPQRVIWKWEDDKPPSDLSPNVLTVKWLPQQDLLGHPNVRLFMSHGGLYGMQETVYHGVPVLGLPMGRDQRGNLAKAEEDGFGLYLEWDHLSEPLLFEYIQKLLLDPSYKGNATRMSKIIRDEPMPAKDLAVYWVEYVLRHGDTKHLRTGAESMPVYQVYMVDLWLFTILVLVVIAWTSCKLLAWSIRKIFRGKAKTE